jgi:hypothetical protein
MTEQEPMMDSSHPLITGLLLGVCRSPRSLETGRPKLSKAHTPTASKHDLAQYEPS